MIVDLLLIASGIFLLVLARKRKKEYRSYGTCMAAGIFLILLPLLVFLAMFFAVASGVVA